MLNVLSDVMSFIYKKVCHQLEYDKIRGLDAKHSESHRPAEPLYT